MKLWPKFWVRMKRNMLTKTDAENEIYLRVGSDIRKLKEIGHEITVEIINLRINAAIKDLSDLYGDSWPEDINEGKVLREITYQHPVQPFTSLSKDRENKRWIKHKKSESDDSDWVFWNAYKEILESKRDSDQIKETEDVIDEILDLSGDPSLSGPWLRRGLVMGNVQSGKTENYLGLINKAADVGYKVVILLGGHINELRNQTQFRVDEGVIGKTLNPVTGLPFPTGVSGTRKGDVKVKDFTTVRTKENASSGGGDFSSNFRKARVTEVLDEDTLSIFVIKKHKSTFEAIINFLEGREKLDGGKSLSLPLLLIDDEADWGSINSKEKQNEITAYNRFTREILSLFDKATYVGYTATPFANIFINPDSHNGDVGQDLFPEDFLVRMPTPRGYSGQQHYFGNVSEVGPSEENFSLVIIDDNEELLPLSHKSDTPVGELPESLKEAIRVFLIVTAIRLQKEGTTEVHNSMLVNVSHITSHQNTIYRKIDEYLESLKVEIAMFGLLPLEKAIKSEAILSMEISYLNNYPQAPYTFEKLLTSLVKTVQKVDILRVNKDGGLDYSEYPKGLSVIAIGGHKLSRGFTLEGLSVSYYARNSKGYDTLMQMCRWFGYRPNYLEYCRVFIPEESAEWYNFITRALLELDLELEHMKQAGARPEDFGLRIRSHPGAMLVTARNKLGTAQEELIKMDLWGATYRGFRFSKDKEKNESNLSLFESYLAKLRNSNEVEIEPRADTDPWIFSGGGIGYDELIELIESLTVLEDKNIPKPILIKHLKLMRDQQMRPPKIGLYNHGGSGVWWTKNLKTQELIDFTESRYPLLDHDVQLTLRAMKEDGGTVYQPSSELRGKIDEKYFLQEDEREKIETSSRPDKNESYLYSDSRNFPSVMFYLFALGEGAARVAVKNRDDAVVNLTHGLTPTLGYSITIPLLSEYMQETVKDVNKIREESMHTYLTNKTRRQVEDAEKYDYNED